MLGLYGGTRAVAVEKDLSVTVLYKEPPGFASLLELSGPLVVLATSPCLKEASANHQNPGP